VSLASILSIPVRFCERRDDVDVGILPADERRAIAAAVPSRQAEFATVRVCARAALADLQPGGGIAAPPILPGPDRAPVWPAGIVGSMTHCDGYRAAAVARAATVASIGIDAEPHAPLPDDVVDLVAHGGEYSKIRRLAVDDPTVAWDRLLFSIKESVFKAWFPLTRQWLGFEQVCVEIDPRTSAFEAHFRVPGPVVGGRRVAQLHGRYVTGDELMLTAVTVPLPATAR